MAGVKTLVGGEIESYREMIEDARRVATDRMAAEAEALGADAVIGVRYTTTSVMQGASEVVAYGTAVRIQVRAALRPEEQGVRPGIPGRTPCHTVCAAIGPGRSEKHIKKSLRKLTTPWGDSIMIHAESRASGAEGTGKARVKKARARTPECGTQRAKAI